MSTLNHRNNMNALELINNLPKAELHLHIEGTFEPELMFAIAERNGIKLPYKSVQELRDLYQFNNLQEFLDIYYQGVNVLQTKQDYYDLTWAYLEKIKADNVVHTEIMFDPQSHTDRGVKLEVVISGICDALKDAEEQLGISSYLIFSLLRHLSEEDCLTALEQAVPYKDKFIAIGLDSSELGHPPEKFTNLYKKAEALGLLKTAHAGEEGPAEYVWNAIDVLGVDRIDHGNRCLDDEKLVDYVVEKGLTLTVCPLSNLKLRVVKDLQQHPIKTMLQKGLKATVNSDDPAYFGGYINDNFKAITEALDLSGEEVVQLIKNSFSGSFLPDSQKELHITKINELIA
ncbi:MAG: adenosine deaminase [Xanthomonadales bacterium]|nr:adenosine deaminase [Xanthomonadales bacterium]MCB1595705.1 adenosine deaminase [Xanthomonadales bacterium]MCB1603393.1 adenosine deaminase [Xanthomonadales bacterium]